MPEWKVVGEENLLADGGLKGLDINGVRILLARVNGHYYAVQAFCSHLGGDLISRGLDGCVVSCVRNESRFDVRDGSVVVWLSRFPGVFRTIASKVMPPKQLKTYETRLQEGQIWVRI